MRGVVWGGDSGPARFELSIDGADWREAALRPASSYGRVRWSATWHAEPGLRTIVVRATDAAATSQQAAPAWNENGYANSSSQRIRVAVV